jgi:putative transposase
VSPARRRQLVPLVQRRGVSFRRACRLLSVARSVLGDASRLSIRDTEVLAAIRHVAQQHPRFGYRRVWALLRRQGMRVNHKRVHRLWRAHGFHLRVRRRSKRGGSPIARMPKAMRPHDVWAYDFVHDRGANGQSLKCLVVVDEDTRMCLAIEVGGRVTASRVIEVLKGLISAHGGPRDIRSDNGPEFVAQAIKSWLAASGISTAYIEAGKPWQNGAVESFIGKFRDECLNVEWFLSRREARVLIEQYRRQYNAERPHSSLGYRTPAEVGAGKASRPAASCRGARGGPREAEGLTCPVVR